MQNTLIFVYSHMITNLNLRCFNNVISFYLDCCLVYIIIWQPYHLTYQCIHFWYCSYLVVSLFLQSSNKSFRKIFLHGVFNGCLYHYLLPMISFTYCKIQYLYLTIFCSVFDQICLETFEMYYYMLCLVFRTNNPCIFIKNINSK